MTRNLFVEITILTYFPTLYVIIKTRQQKLIGCLNF